MGSAPIHSWGTGCAQVRGEPYTNRAGDNRPLFPVPVLGGGSSSCGSGAGWAASIRVHGRGPLSDLVLEALRCSGARIAHSSQPHATVSPSAVDLVVLSDYLVADPRMVRDLHSRGVPHLAVRVRDGTGLVGPLVIPGMFSTVLVSGPDRLGAVKRASRTSQAMTGLWADCGHGVGRGNQIGRARV